VQDLSARAEVEIVDVPPTLRRIADHVPVARAVMDPDR